MLIFIVCLHIPPRFPLQSQYRMEAFSYAAPVPSQKYTGCTFNFSSKESENSPHQPQKKRSSYIIESEDENWTVKLTCFSDVLRTSWISCWKLVFPLIRLTEFLTHDVKVFLFCKQKRCESVSGFAFYLQTGSVLHQWNIWTDQVLYLGDFKMDVIMILNIYNSYICTAVKKRI